MKNTLLKYRYINVNKNMDLLEKRILKDDILNSHNGG